MTVRRILGVMAMIMLCSCAAKSSADIEISSKEYESENSSVYAETIKLMGFDDKDFENEINARLASDAEGALVSFDTMASQAMENLRMGNRCVFEMKQYVKNNSNNFISIIEEHYVYTGGAHGHTVWYPRNIDISSSKTLLLSDLFSDASYKTELNRLIDVILESNKDDYTDLWNHPKVSSEENFYISDGNLIIFYPPYELSYYARGFVEFKIKLEDISGLLKEEYKRLI